MMPMREIKADDAKHFTRGTPVVCIRGGEEGSGSPARATLDSVLAHTGPATVVLMLGHAPQLQEVRAPASEHADRTILWLPLQSASTETEALNLALAATFPGDVILTAPGIEVTEGWCKRLTEAATSDSIVASATPLSLTDGSFGLLDGVSPGEVRDGVEELARRLADRSPRLRPRAATLGPECAYLRRPALELVGQLDAELGAGEALADFALRAVAAGMVHVVADDALFIPSRGDVAGRSSQASTGQGAVQETIANDEHGRLHRALIAARTAVGRLSVTIDGRSLVAAVGGTQTYVLDLIVALARDPRVELRVLTPPDLSQRASDALQQLTQVELISYEQALANPPLSDVVHRPQPIFTADDLALLRLVGERVVIGQQDLIAYHNHAYHRDVAAWRSYRRTTRLALAAADQVIFFSGHARGDALSEDLLPERRAHVVGVGAEALDDGAGAPPSRAPVEGPFLLCLGADYRHKNRPFAIELLGALLDEGWEGRLVMAGPHVPFGSSREQEHELISARPELAGSVIDLGPVDEPVKRWLFDNASALVYPTIYEGLGLLPLEAARAAVPCLFAAQASLAELAGGAATLVPWDARASALAVLPLLRGGAARDAHLSRLRSIPTPPWADVAGELIAVYEQAVRTPPSEAAPRSWQELDREAYVEWLEKEVGHLRGVAQEYQDAYHELERRVSPGLPLIDQGGLLSEAQQRGLMRIAARRGLGALLLSPFGLLGRGDDSEGGPAHAGDR